MFPLVLLALLGSCQALYDSSDDVIELTANNFDNKVIDADEVWIVEFYAPWCGHCRSLAPEYKKAAAALKGVVKVGAVDMDQHQSVGAPYGITGFPTIKIFGLDKKNPKPYNDQRVASSMIAQGMKEAQRMVEARQGGASGSGKRSGGSDDSGDGDVVTLTDANFNKEVYGTKDIVLVEFYAPWCGHCQRLAPEWKKAAKELKGKVKLAALDATVHTATAGSFNVKGYPTIKYFPGGEKNSDSASEYNGGRTASDIVAWALEMYNANAEPPEIVELLGNAQIEAECVKKPICILSFLPHILEDGAERRTNTIAMLQKLGDKYKARGWGWLWTEAAKHPSLESSHGVGGYGYPALVVISAKKGYATLTSSFDQEGIDGLLKVVIKGTIPRFTKYAKELTYDLATVEPWDGKDGEMPETEEIDLSDVDLDDEDLKDTKSEL